MDFSVKNFNVRLRTIKLWELIIAIVISFFLTAFVEGYFNISSGELEYVLFFCFMMVFFLIATYGTTGFNKDDVLPFGFPFKYGQFNFPAFIGCGYWNK